MRFKMESVTELAAFTAATRSYVAPLPIPQELGVVDLPVAVGDAGEEAGEDEAGDGEGGQDPGEPDVGGTEEDRLGGLVAFVVIEAAEVAKAVDLSAPHTVHCLASGEIMISMLGDDKLNGPGGFLLLDEKFEIAGRWEEPAGNDDDRGTLDVRTCVVRDHRE